VWKRTSSNDCGRVEERARRTERSPLAAESKLTLGLPSIHGPGESLRTGSIGKTPLYRKPYTSTRLDAVGRKTLPRAIVGATNFENQ